MGHSNHHPVSPPSVIKWRPEYMPAYLSNGLIGIRVGHIPLLYGVATISGFEGLDPVTGVEALARPPYPLAGDVQIGDAALSDPHRAILREQRYDFSRGELHTGLALDTGEARAEIEVITLCSPLAQHHLGTGPLMTSYSFRAAAGRGYRCGTWRPSRSRRC